MNIALWILQVLLALVFLWAGGMKLALPVEEMTKQMPLPSLFLRFIAVCEVLGGACMLGGEDRKTLFILTSDLYKSGMGRDGGYSHGW